ncbi:17.5 kda class i heat shock protein [Quercus suber]|uniref:17.5 kDa class i heat shock protein n=1 Tax=Quercus suber TaxID=58331 RepID=A0AAW0IKJ8_QUESU
MSLIPSFLNGRQSNIFDPFSQDIWDPFKDFPFPSSSSLYVPQFPQWQIFEEFQVAENAKMDEIKAAMENGVLTVTVPKEEVKKPDVKATEISG